MAVNRFKRPFAVALGAVAFLCLLLLARRALRPQVSSLARVVGGAELGTVAISRRSNGAPALASATPEHGFLTGWVVDVTGNPISDANVVLDGDHAAAVDSDVAGVFVFNDVGPGAHWLSASAGERSAGPVAAIPDKTTGGVTLKLRSADSLEVTVVDGLTQQPIERALVELRSENDPSELTDTSGHVLLSGLEPGQQVLAVSAAGYAASRDPIMIPGTGAGRVRRVVRLQRGIVVSGTVLDASSQPINGAQVDCRDASELGTFDPVTGVVLTDARGTFQWRVPEAGDYRFSARHEAYAPSVSPIVHVGDHPAEGILLRMSGGARLSGRVVTKDGAFVANARVEATSFGGGYGKRALRSVLSDAVGRFELNGLPRAWINVLAASSSAYSAVSSFDLASIDTRSGIDLVLEQDARITGIVVKRQGDPVPGATVIATPAAISKFATSAPLLSARADQHGEFRLTGLSLGLHYQLRTLPAEALSAVVDTDSPYADVTPGEHVTLVLPGDGALKGTVQFADGSSPRQFSVGTGRGPVATFSAGDGHFALERVPPGELTVQVSGSDFSTKVVEGLSVDEDQQKDLGVIVVERGLRISGRVVGSDSRPVSGAMVFASERLIGNGRSFGAEEKVADHTIHSALSNSDGSFVIDGLRENQSVFVGAERDQVGKSPAVAVQVTASAAPLQLMLQNVGRVVGTVKIRGGPAEGVMLSLAQASGNTGAVTAAAVTSVADGSYSFMAVSPGKYQLFAVRRVNDSDVDTRHTEVTVAADAEVRADFDLGGGEGSLNVSVAAASATTSADGSSIFYTAILHGETALVRELSTQGSAQFDDLTPGKYELCIYRINAHAGNQQAARGQPNCETVTINSSAAQLTVPVPSAG